MLTILLITVPFLSGIISFYIRNDIFRRGMLIACACVHLCLSFVSWFWCPQGLVIEWFAFDSISKVFLMITSILFWGASLYGMPYLAEESKHNTEDARNKKFFSREATFSGCLLIFLSTMTMVIASQQLALLWVGIEATTLASAPLIYLHRTRRSLEAMWKYLLICSIGIAIALLGILFLAVADNNRSGMLLSGLLVNAATLNITWLKSAFLLLFVGYGTKMGLAPLHTWLPDAHSEGPSIVSALLSGALLNCAFLGILRIYQVCAAAGLREFCQEIFVFFGLLSVLIASVFILRQIDYKRMLAYSSVEHMGIITLGLGLGGWAVLGSFINMIGHSLTKAGLFFVAGNILSYFKTKNICDVRGVLRQGPRRSGVLWLTGFLLITGMPPSAIFLGKFMLLKEMIFQGRYWVSILFLSALALIFMGMARIFIFMTQGQPVKMSEKGICYKDNPFFRWAIPMLFFILAVSLGVYFPEWLMISLEAITKGL